MAVLSVSRATVRAGRATILEDASVEFPAGQVTAIIGPNGAGKSTLLTVAAGERVPDRGVVRLGGDNIASLRAKHLARRRAVMPQDTTVAFPFTVREVVAMGRTAWEGTAFADDAIVTRALEATDVTDLADREITTLSGGERQRVAFTRVLAQATPVTEGSVILLDEPTSAMDISHAEDTLSLVRQLAGRGAAIGIVMHDLDAAASYADRLVLMAAGRVRRTGDIPTVCAPEVLSPVYGTPIEVFHHAGRLRITPDRAGRPGRDVTRPARADLPVSGTVDR